MSLENSISQVNGCRYLVPNRESESEDFVPPDGSEVYICKLPLDCTEIELFKYVSTKGRVFDVRMMVNFTGSNRGFAFVRYYSPEVADQAITELPLQPLRLNPPWYVSVQKSTDHRRLLLVGMNRRKASGEIQKLFDTKFPGQLACVVELPTEKPIYVLEFVSHKVAAISKRLNTLPLHWGSRVQLMWQPNEDVECRLKLKKEREMLRKVFQDGREMYLKHEEKSAPPAQNVHHPMYTNTPELETLAPAIEQATSAKLLSQSPSPHMQIYTHGVFPSTAQATYNKPSSLLHPTQSAYGRAPSTSRADYNTQPSSMNVSPMVQGAYGVAPSTTQANYGQPSAMPFHPRINNGFQPRLYNGGPTIAQATYGQRPSTSQPTYDQGSLLAHTSLAQPSTFAGLGCAEWKRSDDFSGEDSSFLTNIFPPVNNINYRSNSDQFTLNSPTACYPANAGYKALEASMSARASAAFGYSDWSHKENVPVNKPAPTASVSFFSEPENSAAVGHDRSQTGFSSGGARLILGRGNTPSPPSPLKTLRF